VDTGTAGISGGWAGLVATAVTVALVVVFHRLRDREVLAGDARDVLPRPLARVYLAGAVLVWVMNVGAIVFLIVTGRDTASTDQPAVVVPALALLLAWFVVLWAVLQRVEAAQPDVSGPLAQVGRLIRIGYGSAAPAAWRRLRADD
jgi:hypothetical protein